VNYVINKYQLIVLKMQVELIIVLHLIIEMVGSFGPNQTQFCNKY